MTRFCSAVTLLPSFSARHVQEANFPSCYTEGRKEADEKEDEKGGRKGRGG